jgi:hypothetical protein
MTMGRMAVIVVVATMVFPAARANALVLCAKGKSGAVKEGAPLKVRTSCVGKEVQVDPDAVGLRGPAGAPGSPGADGAAGTDGTDGAPGLSGVEVVTQGGNVIINNTLEQSTATASCPASKKVLGGGIAYVSFGTFLVPPNTIVSRPVTTSPQGWTVSALAQNNDDWGVTAYAVCATTAP